MFVDGYDYSKHVWNDIFVAILSVDFPENHKRVKNLNSQLEKAKINPGYICWGEKSPNKKDRNNIIFMCHRKICEWFVLNRPSKHLLIFEDDAYLCSDKVNYKIRKYIKRLENIDKEWIILNLGCMAFGNVTNIENELYKGKGFAAHSYIHNGNVLEKWLSKISSENWKVPHAVEVWNDFPAKNIYMIHPMLFSQEVHILTFLPGFGNPVHFSTYINTLNSINIQSNYIIFIGLLLVSTGIIKKNKKLQVIGFILFIIIAILRLY